MTQITLINGGYALIDPEDIERLSEYTWRSWARPRRSTYARTKQAILMHRVILGVTDRNLIVDHINGNGLDNRKENLRIVSKATNSQNRQRSRINNRCPGVFWVEARKKWFARITHNYKIIHLGCFIEEDEAIKVLNEYRQAIGRPIVVC